MISFKNKKVLIFGLGSQGGGVGAAKFFIDQGAEVRVTDLKTKEELGESLNELKSYPIQYTLGRHLETDFLRADLVIRNPDVLLNSSFLQFCFKKNIPVEMETSLFAKLCPAKIIGITGTRGKSTTTVLTAKILKEAGLTVFVGGNLPESNTLDLLNKANKDSLIVLELSSWQLQGFGWDKISPEIGVITNIYPDHLDRYVSMEEYLNDKSNIFKFQKKDGYLVANEENKITQKLAKEAKSKVKFFNKRDLPSLISQSFPLLGDHNLENLAAAAAVAKILKIDDQIIQKAIRNFSGLPYRQETVRVFNGVTYINDSTSTTPIAGVVAIKAFSDKPIILICGGNSKNLPLEEFIKEILFKVKKVVLLEGTLTDEMESGIMNYKLGVDGQQMIIGRFNSLQKAVEAARKEAKTGEVILFSPGATSFTMFKNEFDRGEKFDHIVNQLK